MKTNDKPWRAVRWAGVVCVACAGALTGPGAWAQASPGYQAELSYVPLKATSNVASIKPALLRGALSQEVHRHLDVEVLLGHKVQDDEVAGTAPPVKGEVEYHAGVYLKPKLAISPQLQVFARLGHGRTKVKTDLGSRSESDLAHGWGIAYALTRTTSVNLDHMRYLSKDGATVRGYAVGLGYRF